LADFSTREFLSSRSLIECTRTRVETVENARIEVGLKI